MFGFCDFARIHRIERASNVSNIRSQSDWAVRAHRRAHKTISHEIDTIFYSNRIEKKQLLSVFIAEQMREWPEGNTNEKDTEKPNKMNLAFYSINALHFEMEGFASFGLRMNSEFGWLPLFQTDLRLFISDKLDSLFWNTWTS